MISFGNTSTRPKVLEICNIESKMDVILERRHIQQYGLPYIPSRQLMAPELGATKLNWYKKIGRQNFTKFLQLMYGRVPYFPRYFRFSIEELKQMYMYEKWNKMKPSLYTLMLCNKNPKNKNFLPYEIIQHIGSYLKMGDKNPQNKISEDEESTIYDAFFKDMLDYKDLINTKEKRIREMENRTNKDKGKYPSFEWERRKQALTDKRMKSRLEKRDRRDRARRERMAQMKKDFFEKKLVVEYIIAELSKRNNGLIDIDDITIPELRQFIIGDDQYQEVDDTGVDEDILVNLMSFTNLPRNVVIRALINNDNDPVNAGLELSFR